MSPLSPRARGVVFAQLNALCAGAMMAVGKEVTDVLEPQRFIALMYVVVVPVNTVWWLLTHYGVVRKLHAVESEHASRPLRLKGTAWLLAHTGASILGIIGLWGGLARTETAVGSVMSRIEVGIAVVLGLWFLQERFTRSHWLGFGLTVVGLAVVRWTVLGGEPLGFMLLLGGALGFGVAEFTGKLAVKYVPVPRLVVIRGWLMMAALVALWWIWVPGWPQLSLPVWGWLVLAALLGPVLARNLYMLSLSYLPVSQAALLNQLQPVYAGVFGFFLRAEVPAWQFYIGGLAILAGNVALILAREATTRRPKLARS